MTILGVPVNVVNVAIGYSLVIIALALILDGAAPRRKSNDVAIYTIITIVNLGGLWLGIMLNKVLK